MVSLMSGIASLILTVVGWSIPGDEAKRWFWLAGIMCLFIASVGVWYSERKERLRLEREEGPNILMRITKADTTAPSVEFINDGKETAQDIHFENGASEHIQFSFFGGNIAFIQANEAEARAFVVSRRDDTGTTTTFSLAEFLGGKHFVTAIVLFKNTSTKTTYRRAFTLRRPLLTTEVHCDPGPREIVNRTKPLILH